MTRGLAEKVVSTALTLSVVVTTGYGIYSYFDDSSLGLNSVEESSDIWNYFPSRLNMTPKAERLALISRGKIDGKDSTYTPGVYELRIPKNPGYIDVQIWDAPTHEEFFGLNGDVDYMPNGIYTMDLVFEGHSKISCIGTVSDPLTLTNNKDTFRLNTQSLDCRGEEVFKRSVKGDDTVGWSLPLRIYRETSDDSAYSAVTMHTVWEGLYPNKNIAENIPNTFNIFALRSRNGTINLKKTDLTHLYTLSNENKIPFSEISFRTSREKLPYEASINWIFPYSINGYGTPHFVFDISVRDLSEGEQLILLDKDADASKLHNGIGNPADPGVKMKVSWRREGESGDLLAPWTNLDQTSRVPEKQEGYIDGESNAYQGPSWDLNSDERGIESIQWYKFIMPPKKPSDWVRVEWYDFQTFSNAFGFASNMPMYGADVGTTILPPKEVQEEEPPNICLAKNHPDCETQSISLQLAIDSDPPPEMDELKAQNITTIIYHLSVENVTNAPLENVEIIFNTPEYTNISDITQNQRNTRVLTDARSGKNIQGSFLVDLGTIRKHHMRNYTIIAHIDDNAPNDGIISTEKLFIAQAKNVPKQYFPSIRHYLGTTLIESDPDLIFVLKASPPHKSEVKAGDKITYKLFVKNIGPKTYRGFIDVRMGDPPGTEYIDSNNRENGNITIREIPPHTDTEESYMWWRTVKVKQGIEDGVISSQGVFFMTLPEFIENGERKNIYPNVVWHVVGDDTETPCVCIDEGCPSEEVCTDSEACIEVEEPINECRISADPITIGCTEIDNTDLEVCISATPPAGTKGMHPGDVITYHVRISNKSILEAYKNLKLVINAPLYSDLKVGTEIETVLKHISPTISIGPIDLSIIIKDIGEDNFTISSLNKLRIFEENRQLMIIPPIQHHVGEGALSIDRCLVIEGDEDICVPIEIGQKIDIKPNRLITVVDILHNNMKSVYSGVYIPIPLSKPFEYEANTTFKVSSWISVPAIAKDFSSPFPDHIPGALPISSGIPIKGIPPNGRYALHYDYFSPDEGCTDSSDSYIICVTSDPESHIELKVSSAPAGLPDGETLLINDIIRYDIVVENYFEEDQIKNVSIQAPRPKGTCCVELDGSCSQNREYCSIVLESTTIEPRIPIITNYSVKAIGHTELIINPGVRVSYNNGNQVTSQEIRHRVSSPIETLSEFTHEISVNRTVLLNASSKKPEDFRPDGADVSTISHAFWFTGKNFAETHNADLLTEKTRPDPVAQYEPCHGRDLLYYHDAPPHTRLLLYNSSQRNQRVRYNYSLQSQALFFEIITRFPDSEQRPGFFLRKGNTDKNTNQDLIRYEIQDSDSVNSFLDTGMIEINGSMVNRFISPDHVEATLIRAVQDGRSTGKNIITSNTLKTLNDSDQINWQLWEYSDQYSSTGYNCGSRRRPKMKYVFKYQWQKIDEGIFSVSDMDASNIEVYTSTAWIQLERGNMNINSIDSIPKSMSPNNFLLKGETSEQEYILTAPKTYAPPGSYSSEKLIFVREGQSEHLVSKADLDASGRVRSTERFKFNLPSRARLKNKIKDTKNRMPINNKEIPNRLSRELAPQEGDDKSTNMGFIPSAIPGMEGVFQISRGNVYDRQINPRDFEDDLLNRHIFGKVIELSGDQVFSGSRSFEHDSIYHITGNLSIQGDDPFIINGGKARLYVEGDVNIDTDIKYGKNFVKTFRDLSGLPSLRIHTKRNLWISPQVTQIESMMLVEGEFHTGYSAEQLIILGDVIAFKGFFERQPLGYDPDLPEDQQLINRPSEIVIEDYRKYILTPPGDQMLPDRGNIWKEVNMSSGSPVDWSRWTIPVE